MEKLARAQYLKNKNPKDCALLYIALNRVQVLAGLFKISRDEKDKPLVSFLLRNFQVSCLTAHLQALLFFRRSPSLSQQGTNWLVQLVELGICWFSSWFDPGCTTV